MARANLRGTILLHANLGRAVLEHANLKGAAVLAEQLVQAQSLAGATLPDGTVLSKDNWRAEFEEWRKKQEEQDQDG